jgi:HK97 family phage prohead protease
MPLDMLSRTRPTGPVYREIQTTLGDVSADRTFGFVASTTSVDRMGDVLEQDWTNIPAFLKNPVFLWAHQTKELPIGSVLSFTTDAARTRSEAVVRMLPEGRSARADVLTEMIRAKELNAVSVGWIPHKVEDITDAKGKWTGGFRYTQNELLELSLVSVPANPDAMQLARSLGCDEGMIRELFRDQAPAVHGHSTPRRAQAELDLLLLGRRLVRQ